LSLLERRHVHEQLLIATCGYLAAAGKGRKGQLVKKSK